MRSVKTRFYLAVALLAVSGVFLHAAQSRGMLRIIKGALPIRKPLGNLDRRAVSPLMVVSSPALPPETVEELGTKEYINWVLRPQGEDADKAPLIDLAVTYYTGKVDQVPHVPEECYHQGAFTEASNELTRLELPKLGRSVPVRKLSFYPPRDVSKRVFIYYTICVNGDFYADRTETRFRMIDSSETHLYYSKVEVSFRASSDATPASLDERARGVMDGAIEELIRSHWPKRGWEKGGPPKGNSTEAAGPS